MKIGIISYGVGNITSIFNSVKKNCNSVEIIFDPSSIRNFDKIILPGTGSFHNSMNIITKNGWYDEIINFVEIKKKYILGICLGMQLFSTISFEDKPTKGFNFLNAEVKLLSEQDCKFKLPLIGWNEIHFKKKSNFLKNINDLSDVYFVNSYSVITKDDKDVLCKSNYDIDFVSAVEKDNIIGTQFHPEKSSHTGRQILKNFLNA